MFGLFGLAVALLTAWPLGAGRAEGTAPFAGIEVSEVDHPAAKVRWGRAAAEISVPLSRALEVVESYDTYADILPSFHASRVLSRRGSAALVYFEASVAAGAITFWSQMRVGPRKRVEDMEVIDGKMIRGNPELMEARWELRELDDERTHVAFQLFVVPKLPLPAGLVSSENASAAKKVVRALRAHLEGQARKP